MDRIVREPIQTYLTEAERAELDRTAAELGVSRSEALRRGIRALRQAGESPGGGRPGAVATPELVTPPKAGPGNPPPADPILPLDEVLRGLQADREER